MKELIDDFSLERVGKHGSKFDPEKARWFNHQYMMRKSDEDLAQLLSPLLLRHGVKSDQHYITRTVHLIRDRAILTADLWNASWFFFVPPKTYDEQVVRKIWNQETSTLVTDFAAEAALLAEWNKDSLHTLVAEFITRKGVKMGALMNPLRLLVVGSNQGPGMMEIAELLGKKEFLSRITKNPTLSGS